MPEPKTIIIDEKTCFVLEECDDCEYCGCGIVIDDEIPHENCNIIIPEMINNDVIAGIEKEACRNFNNAFFIFPSSITFIDLTAFDNSKNIDIAYEGTSEQLEEILLPDLMYDLEEHNIHIASVFELYACFDNIRDFETIKSATIENKIEQKYMLNKLKQEIKYTNDINLKLKMLGLYDDIKMQNICQIRNEFER